MQNYYILVIPVAISLSHFTFARKRNASFPGYHPQKLKAEDGLNKKV